MNRSLVILALGSLMTACTVTVNTNDSPSGATEGSLMQADRDFAVAVNRTGSDAGKEGGHGRYVTQWRRDGDHWLVIMDTGYPEPATAR